MSHTVIGVLILSGIGAVLAFLLELAGRFIADYGECRILINGEKEITVNGGVPLLFALMEEGIFIPSACGGKGTCAYCKLKVLEGGGQVLATETGYLSKQEMSDHVRLSCQVKVRGDLVIEIPEELFEIREFRVRVERITDMTPNIKGLKLAVLSPEEGLSFRPGQYVQLEVPAGPRSSQPEYRAYSIASPSSIPKQIELFIARVQDGLVSSYIHENLKLHQELSVRGPFGDFYYRDSTSDLLFIATGSGLAPILSILRYIESEGISRKTMLFFGTRREENLYCREELRRLEKKLADFQFIPVLSRVPIDADWKGERGRVTDLIVKFLPESFFPDVYICGNSDMVESCRALLLQRGISGERIFFDKFT